MPALISRFGFRWQNATNKLAAKAVLRDLIIRHNVAEFATTYDMLRDRDPTNELKLVASLRNSHAHAAKNHFDGLAEVTALLFEKTRDPTINFVEMTVFGVEVGAPIMNADHPCFREL